MQRLTWERVCVWDKCKLFISTFLGVGGFPDQVLQWENLPNQSFVTTPLLHAVLSPVEGCFTSGRLSAWASSGADTCNTVSRLTAMDWDDGQFFIGMFFVGLSLFWYDDPRRRNCIYWQMDIATFTILNWSHLAILNLFKRRQKYWIGQHCIVKNKLYLDDFSPRPGLIQV